MFTIEYPLLKYSEKRKWVVLLRGRSTVIYDVTKAVTRKQSNNGNYFFKKISFSSCCGLYIVRIHMYSIPKERADSHLSNGIQYDILTKNTVPSQYSTHLGYIPLKVHHGPSELLPTFSLQFLYCIISQNEIIWFLSFSHMLNFKTSWSLFT